ncbi:MAG: hypothetical protein KUG77_12195 [Nannocystaceae bacterium]|nr:hypothetical protein [Nannocystaceae bacterium]
MSAAEIADNRWELSATKPPTTSPAGIGLLMVMSLFALFFVSIVVGSVLGIIQPKGEGLAGEYKNLNKQGTEAPAAAE